MFTDKKGNIINDNRPEESNNTEITVVSTGLDNTGTNNMLEAINNMLEVTNNNSSSTGVGNTETNISTEVDYTETNITNNILEDTNMLDNTEINTQEESTPEMCKTHTTQEDKEETYKEPTAYDEQIIE